MRRPIHVVQIISTLSVSDFGGGSELFGIRLAEGLRQAGFKVAIIPLWSHDTSVERQWFHALTRQGIAIHYGAPFRDGVKMRHNIIAAFVGSCRHIHNLRPDIVNTHGEYSDL